MTDRITAEELQELKACFAPLIGLHFRSLSLPLAALSAFEPSQIGTIVGALMDAMIPHLEINGVGLKKHGGSFGDREGYPDYQHVSGKRVELKLLYVDNYDLKMKKPPTPREPSARVTQKVTVKNVDPQRDAMLLTAYRIEPDDENPQAAVPRIIDFEVLSMTELVEARDKRMTAKGGRWFGDHETPTILSNIGRKKIRDGSITDVSIYGRKKSEGKDYNEDTNFGKLKRIPHRGLQSFLAKYRLTGTLKKTDLKKVIDEIQVIDEELQDGHPTASRRKQGKRNKLQSSGS